ncbi:hypothetical protein AS156_09265 [Bradyrhizobium macuxiense]|uniref:Uncharacterized protein n=1 Tax=Bradyrhizobium macuxiense TaxID=1755647 RepID=A0A109JQF0_9BRAD|nr:hypothetical protein [Bradyrhizobium macuxiense]KWV52964.1 hypothetical protein AS156_09265 [Bradyrhizobium macuxiense]
MRAGPTILVIALLLLLGATGWFAYEGLSLPGSSMPIEGIIALVAGGIFSIVVGAGLMVLLFFSSRRGYDEPPRLMDDRDIHD